MLPLLFFAATLEIRHYFSFHIDSLLFILPSHYSFIIIIAHSSFCHFAVAMILRRFSHSAAYAIFRHMPAAAAGYALAIA